MIKIIIKKLISIKWLEAYIQNNPIFLRLLIKFYNRTLGINKIRIKHNKLFVGTSLLNKSSIVIIGSNNLIEIDDLSYLYNSKIIIRGNNNIIKISKNVIMYSVHLNIEDDWNSVTIGSKTTFYGRTDLAAIEGTSITIGEDCMFSGNIQIRTGDSHSIINRNGNRINYSKNISIGSHVWFGANIICLKGSNIPNNCIVGAGSILSSSYENSNSIIVGNPAKIIRSDVNWTRDRL